ncbi:putative ABC multidrug transporter [Microdochium trichocladiopsis]|uniref:ABC multidrug transporter n=1 Tax=Microdochium trichocladiopsis TaxID=1682393 RepID=A0A9P9BIE9_9PEZI|nr:putative ABC multidrug transporter [Microdochium trichocladiopsis]KAH7014328.1 putative ABC multidrug transporter [Microdochium trichocladiopsis]
MPFSSGDNAFFPPSQTAFDFNIEFEQLFFSILPSVLFICSSIWRALLQTRKPTVVDAPMLQIIKVGCITMYAGLELALLVFAAVGSLHVTSLFLAASALKLISALSMVIVSMLDHSKSVRPSILLSGYLFLTLLLDIVQSRTLFLASEDEKPELTYSALFCAALAIKVAILLLEGQKKSCRPSWHEKSHSPEETSNLFSLGVFFWLNKLFLQGYHKVLRLSDLYALDSALDARRLHDTFTPKRDYTAMRGDPSSLLKSLIRTLWLPLVIPIAPRVALLAFTFCQPLFIEKLLEHLAQPEVDANVGYGLIGASILIYAGIAISTALYNYLHRRMLAMLRSILVTEIYAQATQARPSEEGTDDGDNSALTLMSTDLERIDLGLRLLHDVWASLLQSGLAAWMLYRQLGLVFITPIGIVTACFLGLAVLMNMTGDSQREWMAQVQRRVGLTATVIANMKNLKLSGLSQLVGDFVQNMRVDELAAGARFRKIYILAAILGFIPMLFSPPLTYAFAQTRLDPTTMFTSLSYLLLLTGPLSEVFQIIPSLLAAIACIGRIQTFLMRQTVQDYRIIENDKVHEKVAEKAQFRLEADASVQQHTMNGHEAVVAIENASFGWQKDVTVLNDLTLQLHRSTFTVVIGSVGSGKSSLCRALLGEMPYNPSGSITLSTRFPHVAYCDQTPFLCNGSLRDNIVGFSAFDPKRFAQVIQATALDFDLKRLPNGDLTNIGSSGITLSGGQKQRVSLARALYLQTDLIVLDDVLTGLDADTEEKVFDRVFGPRGLLKQRQSTALLCTHSIRHLPAADHIVVLDKGSIAEQGTFETLLAHHGYVHSLGLTKQTPENLSRPSSSELVASEAPEEGLDLTVWSDKPELSIVDSETSGDAARQIGDKKVYVHYFKSMGVFVAMASFCFAAGWGFFTSFPTIWLKYWSDDVYSEAPTHTYAYYAGIYALLQACAMISLLLLGITIFIVSTKRAGANLHKSTLDTLIRAPLAFFTMTDTGVVTNLFSQDLNLIDTDLPNMLLNVLFVVTQAIGAAIIMLTASPYMAASYPFLIALLYVVQKFYLRTSRQLRLLDLETKSPLYTHFIDTIKGITTLRAFGFMSKDVEKNAGLLNSSQRPAYLLVMVQQWLNLVLNLVVMALAAVLTTMAVRLHSNSGFTGAALVSLMTFGDNLSGIVIFYTRLETSIGAVARLKAFQDNVKPEDRPEEDLQPSIDWPNAGAIELQEVSASYENGSDSAGSPKLALSGLCLSIEAGERVAVCGRTGSGKSSLVALLLKLLDPLPGTSGGSCFIDGSPLARLDRQTLRQRIIAVPQEAVFLPDGTSFQINLDPTGASTLEECEAVLGDVGLLDFVTQRGGPSAPMNASVLSAGQRQLLSLGRAVLRRRIRSRQVAEMGRTGPECGILLLDEVSSSVDQDTEKTMLDIIRAEFEGYTIIAVSHRLDMIMDFDRVVVMDTGHIVEVGRPTLLAREDGSRFAELVNASAK